MSGPSRVLVGKPLAPPPPDCSIDYARLGGLPAGVPPQGLPLDSLGAWFAAMSATAAVRFFVRPADDAIDPQAPADGRVAQLANHNSTLAGISGVLVRPDLGVGAPAALALTAAQLAAVSRTDPVPAAAADRATWFAALATRYAWDDSARAASAAPLPCPGDEVLAVLWRPDAGTAALPTLPTRAVGALDSVGAAQATYVLTTDGTASRGELEPRLVRAAHPSLVRFERYRHLGVDSGGALHAIRTSATGRLLLHASPLPAVVDAKAILDDEPTSPWLGAIDLVYENIDAGSVAPNLAAIAWDQLVHLEARLAEARFAQDKAFGAALVASCSRVVQTWRAWLALQIFPGTASADVTSMAVRAAGAVPLDAVPLAKAALVTAVAAVLADAQLRANLLAFTVGIYAPLLAGDDTADLFVPRATVTDEGFATAYAVEQGVLLALLAGPAPWLPVFAGAPLGEAAAVYTFDGGAPADAAGALRAGMLVADLEAIHLAGAAASAHLAAAPPSPDATAIDAAAPLDLSAFAALAAGTLLVVRLVGSGPAFTTADWLSELTRGCTRHVSQLPLFEPWDLAGAGHPLLAATAWENWRAGYALRGQLDQLSDVRVPSGHTMISLGRAAAAWWGAHVVVTDGSGNWPWLDWTTQAFQTTPPGPTSPFLRAGPVGQSQAIPSDPPVPVVHVRHPAQTRAFPTKANPTLPVGFDDQDLEVALAVTELVRNGADRDLPVDLAVVLALMERENYRSTSARRRGRESEAWDLKSAHNCFHPGGALVAGVPAEYQGRDALGRYEARTVWAAQHYGMDRLVIEVPSSAIPDTNPTFAQVTAKTFDDLLAELTAGDADGRRLLDPAFVPSGDVARFIDERVSMAFQSPTSMTANLRVISPRLQLVGVALQQAIYQWFHQQLVAGTAYHAVAEYTAAAPPAPGDSANEAARRDYVAYYAAVYLAYNTASGPGEWNHWMTWADSHRGAISASRFLVFDGDPSGQTLLRQGQLGHISRFAVGLDGYARLDVNGRTGADASDPAQRQGVW